MPMPPILERRFPFRAEAGEEPVGGGLTDLEASLRGSLLPGLTTQHPSDELLFGDLTFCVVHRRPLL
jgi:hypothetical protein